MEQSAAKTMGIIYKLTSPSNKVYIGQTIQPLQTRIYQHARKNNQSSCRLLNHAIKKHGINKFDICVVVECSRDKLNAYEQYYIQLFNSLSPNGYNLTSGGDGNYHVSLETRQLNSQIIKKRHNIENLPLYVGTVRSNQTIIGYKVRGHPNNPKQVKFVNKDNLPIALESCMKYYEGLNNNEDINISGKIGRRRDGVLPRYMYNIKERDQVVGYFVQHPDMPGRKKFMCKHNLTFAFKKATQFLQSIITQTM